MALDFADNFSELAQCYGRHRPSYPQQLFEMLADAAPSRGRAWDAGTGSGQAAVRLAEYFDAVVATDASAAQIAHAWAHPRVEYRVEAAEETSLETGAFDLVTSGQAAHWFRIDAFYDEVRRVLKPDGVLALFCYGQESVNDDVNAVIERLYVELLGPYWPKRTLSDHTYQDIPFPFEDLPRRVFRMHMQWTLDDLLNGFRTWSAALRYEQAHHVDPIDLVADDFRAAWGDPERPRRVSWPIYVRLGRPVGTGSYEAP